MKSIADIMAIREAMQSQIILRDNTDAENEIHIIVGMGTCGINAGARTVFNALVDEIETRDLKGVRVTRSGCLGNCEAEPAIEVHVPGKEVVKYAKLDAKKAVEIIEKHIIGGNVCTEYLA